MVALVCLRICTLSSRVFAIRVENSTPEAFDWLTLGKSNPVSNPILRHGPLTIPPQAV